jgi:predicted phosphoribosyltransferase
VLAVPTAPLGSLQSVSDSLTEIYCPNIRDQLSFAVAEAYENWHDLSDEEVAELLRARS